VFKIEKMDRKTVREIADNWKYPGVRFFYNMAEDIEDYEKIVSPARRAENYFKVKKVDELFGSFCIQQTEDTIDEIELELGIKPEFTGRGMKMVLSKE
jgi:hypothetical protein